MTQTIPIVGPIPRYEESQEVCVAAFIPACMGAPKLFFQLDIDKQRTHDHNLDTPAQGIRPMHFKVKQRLKIHAIDSGNKSHGRNR